MLYWKNNDMKNNLIWENMIRKNIYDKNNITLKSNII